MSDTEPGKVQPGMADGTDNMAADPGAQASVQDGSVSAGAAEGATRASAAEATSTPKQESAEQAGDKTSSEKARVSELRKADAEGESEEDDGAQQNLAEPANEAAEGDLQTSNGGHSNGKSADADPAGDIESASAHSGVKTGAKTDAPKSDNGSDTPNTAATRTSTQTPHIEVAGSEPTSQTPNGVSERASQETLRHSSQHSRRRTLSVALSRGSVDGTETKSGMVFIKGALETIRTSRDGKRIPVLAQAIKKVLDRFDEDPNSLPSAESIMEPLRIVCAQGSSTEMRVVALDCIGKLLTFGYLEDDDFDGEPAPTDITPAPRVPLLTRAVDIVCDTFDAEATDSRIELQIIKALTAAIVNDDLIAHGPTLLKAVRQIYNIFVVSKSQANQTIAQVSLTQSVQVVFDRAKTVAQRLSSHKFSTSVSESTSRSASISESRRDSTSMLERPGLTLEQMKTTVEEEPTALDDADFVSQDAFLLFRTFCKLSEKSDVNVADFRSHGMRSKLLSLHLLHLTLKQHISVFSSKNLFVKFRNKNVRFIDAIKSYLWSTLSRNAASISPPVYEISAEIFWLLVSNLRSEFKREILVFFKEVYFTIIEMRTSTVHQKLFFLGILHRLCNDPRALVELYLNYDCDTGSMNVFEHMINLLVKIAIAMVPMTQQAMHAYVSDKSHHHIVIYNLNQPPSLSISHIVANGGKLDVPIYPREYAMKTLALGAIVSVLRSLHIWYQRETQSSNNVSGNGSVGETASTTSLENDGTSEPVTPNRDNAVKSSDDPSQFESIKLSKKALDAAISDFNYRPESGIRRMISSGIIKSRDPTELASVFLNTRGFDLYKLGEFLGKDDAFNRAILHNFVDLMDFKGATFISALRHLLQQFRLPGEGQVVDRYMLEFATKYTHDNPTVFSTAETPYVLGYSVMMLNTELHSAQVKRSRMTAEEFIANNRGINDGLDLPDAFLHEIYNEIQNNEIKLVSEHEDATIRGHIGADRGGLFGNRTDNTEAYLVASEVIASKTAKMFKSFASKDRRSHGSVYYNASHIEHVHPMFTDCWMSILAGLSGPFQQTNEKEIVDLCLEGFQLAIRIACHFDIELARISFVQALTKFANLTNPQELKLKNVDATKTLLHTALQEGNTLRSSWYDVLVIVSQLELVQLIANGVAPASLPLFNRVRIKPGGDDSYILLPEVAQALCSRDLVVSSDHIFTQSASLNGSSIIDFVKSLAAVSLEEIENSQDSEQPRLFCLQKMVDVCYYNMDRIRMEWSQIWAVMGDQFNRVCTNPNEKVVMTGLDSLRQLSVRFLDLDELPHFQFQKEFLKPFRYTLENSTDESAKLLVIDCLAQMVLAKSQNLKSGWITIFNVIGIAASQNRRIVSRAFDLLSSIASTNINLVFSQEANVLDALYDALCAMAKQSDVKPALHASEILNSIFSLTDKLEIWDQVSERLHDVIMHGKDLEVRSKSLGYLFDMLMENGSRFTREYWDKVCKTQLFPLFYVLEENSGMPADDMNLWMSTTLVQALRNIIALFDRYFDALEHALDVFFLDLLKTCICQENDTVAQIGSSCLVQLVTDNASRFTDSHWNQITSKIEQIFVTLTAKELTGEVLLEADSTGKPPVTRASIAKCITKCIQQLLLIEMVKELFMAEKVYSKVPTADLLRLSSRVYASYEFARGFNKNHELRKQLWQRGYMKQMPNLLLQESSAAQVYVTISFKLYGSKERLENDYDAADEIQKQLFPMCANVMKDYNALQPQDHRHIKAVMPIVVSILQEMKNLDAPDFKQNIKELYMEVIDVLNKDMGSDLREAVQSVLRRVAEVHFGH